MRVQPENFSPLQDFLARPESFRVRERFLVWARAALPLPADGGADYLQPEAWWRQLVAEVPDAAAALAALSQAIGVYFFPSREWPGRLVRFLVRLGVRRLLEAGAGRGYLAQALLPRARAAGLECLAVDRGEGDYVVGLPVSPVVVRGDAFQAAREFRPQAILSAWPPPGQSVAPFLCIPGVRWVIVAGEPGGGVTGAREDWERLPCRPSAYLSRFCRGRSGPARHQVAVFTPGEKHRSTAVGRLGKIAGTGGRMGTEHFPVIVEEECIACGACVEICPEVFSLNESLGFAIVINPGGGEEEKIQEAIDTCPVHCIHWSDELPEEA